MKPTIETLQRWTKEGIRQPRTMVASSWRCPVCRVDAEHLSFASGKIPEAVVCDFCGLPFSLPQHHVRLTSPPVPLPAVSPTWVEAWCLGFRDQSFCKGSRALGVTPFYLMLKAFPSAQKALNFFTAQDKGRF